MSLDNINDFCSESENEDQTNENVEEKIETKVDPVEPVEAVVEPKPQPKPEPPKKRGRPRKSQIKPEPTSDPVSTTVEPVKVEPVKVESKVEQKVSKVKVEPKEKKKSKYMIRKEAEREAEIQMLKDKMEREAELAKKIRKQNNPVNQAEEEVKELLKGFTKKVDYVLSKFRKTEDKDTLVEDYNRVRDELDVDFDNIISAIPSNFKIPERIYIKVEKALDRNLAKVERRLN
jgi:hypothetical protein